MSTRCQRCYSLCPRGSAFCYRCNSDERSEDSPGAVGVDVIDASLDILAGSSIAPDLVVDMVDLCLDDEIYDFEA